jgi:hypothetical protein
LRYLSPNTLRVPPQVTLTELEVCPPKTFARLLTEQPHRELVLRQICQPTPKLCAKSVHIHSENPSPAGPQLQGARLVDWSQQDCLSTVPCILFDTHPSAMTSFKLMLLSPCRNTVLHPAMSLSLVTCEVCYHSGFSEVRPSAFPMLCTKAYWLVLWYPCSILP